MVYIGRGIWESTRFRVTYRVKPVIASQCEHWRGNPYFPKKYGMTFLPYSPMDCMMPLRATFMGSLSGSLAEGSPSQSQRYTASSWGSTPKS